MADVNARTEPLAVDEVIAAAVEQARAAAVELAGADVGIVEAGGPAAQVGGHLGVRPEGEYAATHAFAATLPGYVGWYWAVTMVRAPDGPPCVAEVVLLPGDGALLAPAWVPWSERLQPGDLSPGDLLPPPLDDPRLVPGYTDSGDPQVEQVAFELGLGRVQVLSRYGRLIAADRWLDGDFGPDTPMAKQAPAHCGTCGFFLALGGSLQAAFGVCANEFAAADGRVVAVEYGCGAHSETVADPVIEPPGPVYEDELIEVIDRSAKAAGSPESPPAALVGTEPDEPELSAEPSADDAEQAVIDLEADSVQPVDEDQFAEAGQGEYEPGGVQVGDLDPAELDPPAVVEGGVEEPPPGDAG
jgi:hypothetical protein